MPGQAIPFTAAAHRYREKIFTTTVALGAAAQDLSAPWKLQVTANTQANIWTTVTSTNSIQEDVFLEAWTVPSPQNPLNPQIAQAVAPPLLGSLNKWTVQQYALTASGTNNVLL